jgi:hypothetical protein
MPSVPSYKRFLPQNRGLRRCLEGAAYLLPQLATLALVIYSYNVLPTPCFVHRVDAKPQVFIHRLYTHSSIQVQKYRAPALLSRGSDSMTKLAAAIA